MKTKERSPNSGLAQLGFESLPQLVLYLEIGFLFDTFGLPNPQLTPSHETLPASHFQKIHGRLKIVFLIRFIIKLVKLNRRNRAEDCGISQ